MCQVKDITLKTEFKEGAAKLHGAEQDIIFEKYARSVNISSLSQVLLLE